MESTTTENTAQKPPKSMADRVIRAGSAVLVAHLCLKLAGIVQNHVIPNHYGLATSDVFATLYDSVIGTAFLLGEQCFAPAYLPVYAASAEKDGEKEAWVFASALFNLQFLIVLVIVGALCMFPEQVVSFCTRWETDAGGTGDAANIAGATDRYSLAVKMLPLMAPGLIGMSLASLTYVVLNAYKEFFWAAFGDAALKLSIVIAALAGTLAIHGDKTQSANWQYLVVGAVLGGSIKLLTHLFALGPRRLKHYRFTLNFDHRVWTFWTLALPLLSGVAVSRARDIVLNKALTTGHGLPTVFKQGRSIVDSLGFLVPYTLSIALLPYFCDLSAKGDNKRLGELLTGTVRMLLWFFVPLAALLACAAEPACNLLYKGKGVGLTASEQAELITRASMVTRIFCAQLPFVALEMMVMQAYFSSKRVIAPTVAGFVFSAIAAAVGYFAVITGGMTDGTQILLTVGGAIALTKIGKSLLLLLLLRRNIPVLPTAETAGFGVKLLTAAAVAAAASLGVSSVMKSAVLPKLASLGERKLFIAEGLAMTCAGAAAFLLLSLVMKMEEPGLCLRWAKEKLSRRGKK